MRFSRSLRVVCCLSRSRTEYIVKFGEQFERKIKEEKMGETWQRDGAHLTPLSENKILPNNLQSHRKHLVLPRFLRVSICAWDEQRPDCDIQHRRRWELTRVTYCVSRNPLCHVGRIRLKSLNAQPKKSEQSHGCLAMYHMNRKSWCH